MDQRQEFVMHGSFFAHRALMRDAELLKKISQRVHELTKEELDQLKKWYDFFWNMMEAHHAAEDDLLFRAVEERLDQPSEVIEVMEVEHNRIQFLIDELKRILGELGRNGSSASLNSQFQSNAVELLKVFRSHITKEEKYIFEKMSALFTEREQLKIEQEVKRKAPVRYLSYMIPWLSDSLSQEENKILDQSLPAMARIMNRWFWKEKYRRMALPVKAMAKV